MLTPQQFDFLVYKIPAGVELVMDSAGVITSKNATPAQWTAVQTAIANFDTLWAVHLAKVSEETQAPVAARDWFVAHPTAVAFIREPAAQQETEIDAMTTVQLKTLLKYLTIAVCALVKERYIKE